MAVDRSKFKATEVSAMKQQEKEVSKVINKSSDRTDYLSLDEGTNKVRLFPAHAESKSFIYPYGRWWLMKEVTYENKDGETITEVKKRPIYSAKIHGGSQHDIVEEYVKFASKIIADEETDEEALKAKLEKLTHWRDGLRLKPEWVAYVNKYVNGQKQFGLMTISNGIKNKLNELSISEDNADTPITTDPFTDVDDGKAVIITYDKKAKQAKDVYKATLEWRGDYSLTDDELESFSKMEPLEKLFSGVYKRRDFDLAVEGIRYYDVENKLNIFEHDEFIDIVEKLQKEWPEETDEETSEEVEDEKTGSDEDDSDGLDELSRDELKKFIKKNQLDIVVKTAMKDDEIRQLIRVEQSLAFEENEVEEEVEDEVEETEETSEKPMSAIEKARAALGKK